MICVFSFSYFVIDGAELQDRFVQEITLGFYATGKHTNSEFSLNIGQIRVRDTHTHTAHRHTHTHCGQYCDLPFATHPPPPGD